ncbi:uncharacterized protein [Ranitomeya imitator]
MYGAGALMAKTDIESAFRLLPVHPESIPLLGCFWNGEFYLDRCLPMGCSISCSLFETFSTFLEWVVRDVSDVASVIHYLDDFMFVGPPDSAVCGNLLATMEWVSGHFGVPLAQEKTEGPCTVLSFLGILIDSRKMECRLPDDKLLLLKQEVSRIGKLRKVTLKELQSLLGRLNFACRIMPMGRIFCRRLSRATAGVRAAHHFIRLSREHKDDLLVWQRFLENYNGRSLIQQEDLNAFDCEIYTDAAGGAGYGAYCAGKWSVGVWPEEWRQNGLTKNLALLELFPIVVAAFIWGENFKDRRVRFHCDNLSVVSVINSLSSSSPPVIRLVRELVLRCLELNSWISAVHVPGVQNNIADALSRFQWDRFRELAPDSEPTGAGCPSHLWQIVAEGEVA